MGFKVELGKNVLASNGYMAGSIEERLEDLYGMFKNPNVKAVFCSNGGTSAIQLVDKINYELIKANPKIFVGLSDPSVLVLSIFKKANLVTFNGPTGYNFGEGGVTPYTEKYFLSAIMKDGTLGKIKEISEWKIIKEGRLEGEIVGGNILSLQSLIGTPYLPDFRGKILFWEMINMDNSDMDFLLSHYKLSGVFDEIKGMIIGGLSQYIHRDEDSETFEEMIKRIFKEYNFPILYNVDLGHTDNKITIPLGIKVEIIATNEEKALIFKESPTIEA